jgi:hypothetical protein
LLVIVEVEVGHVAVGDVFEQKVDVRPAWQGRRLEQVPGWLLRDWRVVHGLVTSTPAA